MTSAVFNNVVSGLKGMNINVPITHEQVEDSIISERLLIIKEYMAKGLLPRKDFLVSIPCITLDSYPIEKCPAIAPLCGVKAGTDVLHFTIPLIIQDFAEEAIEYLGDKNRVDPFKVYVDNAFIYNQFRTRRSLKPYAWIDMTPNAENRYDGYIFNAPLLEEITVVLIPKDPRQINEYSCCPREMDPFSFFAADVEKRVTEKFLRYYRQIVYLHQPSDNSIKP